MNTENGKVGSLTILFMIMLVIVLFLIGIVLLNY